VGPGLAETGDAMNSQDENSTQGETGDQANFIT